MGDPRRFTNKYERPRKLWDEMRLGEEKAYKKDYALKNMRELWVSAQELKKYRREARRLLSLTEEERRSDATRILEKLNKFGILQKTASLDDVLSLTVRDVLERRLQTLVVRKGLAKTMRQGRQLITHGFISVNGRRVSAPSYLVDTKEEPTIAYSKPIDLTIKAPEAEPEKTAEKAVPKEAPKDEAPAAAS
jgi:small subunit ribosomal protein S4